MGFGDSEFRIDEDLKNNRIIFTLDSEANRVLLLKTVESMVEKLKDEVMEPSWFIECWDCGLERQRKECSFVEIGSAREAVAKKFAKVRDIAEDRIPTDQFAPLLD